ncbi:hypothetical protein OHA25_14590 [Nonomuraea sp. NBC_00507]|uniref:hypothetical protein n=1 Tax=Nonomuraea sp. NBC_00507 TaxID=2976002 RepID=UPI002E17CD48
MYVTTNHALDDHHLDTIADRIEVIDALYRFGLGQDLKPRSPDASTPPTSSPPPESNSTATPPSSPRSWRPSTCCQPTIAPTPC